MKNLALMLFVAIFCSTASVLLYDHFKGQPTEIITIQDRSAARYANNQSGAFMGYDADYSRELRFSAAPTDFTAAADIARPCVVNIRSKQSSKRSTEADYWHDSDIGTSTGSGVIISSDGYIVTNHHVIEGGRFLEVTLQDNRTYTAKLIGKDTSTDLALLKIDKNKLPYINFGNSDSTRIGEWVLAVGNPFNLTSTVTAGIVSAKGRNINILEGTYKIESFIQTDAVVNPGNSGGALVNTNGVLVGINTAIMTKSGSYEGYSFAVPSNLVRKVVEDLQEFGTVQRGFLGVSIEDVTETTAKEAKLKEVEGVYVIDVSPRSAAADAKLKSGDVITHINGLLVQTTPALQEQVAHYRPGDALKLRYIREGKSRETTLTLKDENNRVSLSSKRVLLPTFEVLEDLGFELRPVSKDEMRIFDIKQGLKVISVRRGSTIDRTDLKPGFIIKKVNEKPIETVEELAKIIEKTNKKILLEGFYEDYPSAVFYSFQK